ncbi:hypothetical protein GJV06_09350 [Enterobacteriaceae bacterium RIT691]|nr:hypothetical protein [Enterobacteriaceae bacterium RIT691]
MMLSFMNNHKKIISVFFLLSIFYPFSTTAPYWDDEARFAGDFIWLMPLGRIVPELYYRFISLGDFIVDAQIFNVILITFSFFILLNSKPIHKHWLTVLFFLASPFLSENLLYHIDGIAMLIAYITSIYAAFYISDCMKKEAIISFLIFLFSIMCYQAALNSFAIATFVFFTLNISYGDKFLIKHFCIKATVFVLGLFSLKIIASITGFIYNNDYLSQRSNIDLAIVNEQAHNFAHLIISSLPNQYLLFFSILLVSSIVFALLKAYRQTCKKEYFSALFLIFVLPVSFFFLVFPYIIVDSSSVVVARILFGFGGLIALFYSLHSNEKGVDCIALILSLVLLLITAIGFSVYASTYNKKIDIELHAFRDVQQIIDRQNNTHKRRALIVCNSNPDVNNNPMIRKSIKAFPFIKFPDHAGTTWENGATSGFLAINNIDFDFKICENIKNYPVQKLIFDGDAYKVFSLGNEKYYLEFSNGSR